MTLNGHWSMPAPFSFPMDRTEIAKAFSFGQASVYGLVDAPQSTRGFDHLPLQSVGRELAFR